MSDRKLSPEGTIQLGWLAIFGSVGFFIFNNFEWAITCLFVGIMLIPFGYWRKKYNDHISDFILIPSFVIIILFPMYISLKLSGYMNQQASKQKICGVVENIRIVEGRGVSTFDLVGNEGRQKFSYYRHKDILETSPSFCIDYSFDKRWSDYPYVFNIEPKRI